MHDFRTFQRGTAILTPLSVEGLVIDIPGGMRLIESSSAFWEATLIKRETESALSFEYDFLSIGDGDELGIWVNDLPYLLLPGEAVGTGAKQALIDISGLNPGEHKLIVALHSVGTGNAIVSVTSFEMITEQKVARFERGDSNSDGSLDISDAVHILTFLFLGGQFPNCFDASDVNDDDSVDISDPIAALGFLFLGNATPPPPFGHCGLDETNDDLKCLEYTGCHE